MLPLVEEQDPSPTATPPPVDDEGSASMALPGKSFITTAAANFASIGRTFMPPPERPMPSVITTARYADRASEVARLLSSVTQPFAQQQVQSRHISSPLSILSNTRSASSPPKSAHGSPSRTAFNVDGYPTPVVPGYLSDSLSPPLKSRCFSSLPHNRILSKEPSDRLRSPAATVDPSTTRNSGPLVMEDVASHAQVVIAREENPHSSPAGSRGQSPQSFEGCADKRLEEMTNRPIPSPPAFNKDHPSSSPTAGKAHDHSDDEQTPTGPHAAYADEADEFFPNSEEEDEGSDYGETELLKTGQDQCIKDRDALWASTKALVNTSLPIRTTHPAASTSRQEDKASTPDDWVSTGFDDLGDSDAEDSDEDSTDAKAARSGGRPSKEALAECLQLGMDTRAAAKRISAQYGLQYQTVMMRAGLALKKTMAAKNLANAVRQVQAHDRRQAPDKVHGDVDIKEDAKQWLEDNKDDTDAQEEMIKRAKALDASVLDFVSVNRLRRQTLAVAKQLTELAKTYYFSQDFFILGVVIHMGDEFASSLFASDLSLLNKVLAGFGIDEQPRAALHKAKILLQGRALEIKEQKGKDKGLVKTKEPPPPLTKADFTKPEKLVRDWVQLFVGRILVQEMNLHKFCGRFQWGTWHKVAFKSGLVLMGSDRYMPLQPGPKWAVREAGGPVQGHYMQLLQRFDHPDNPHFNLPPGSFAKGNRPPAVVSHDGQILVYTADCGRDSAEAQALCVPYTVEPLPEDAPLVPKKSTRKRRKQLAGTVKEPIQLDSDEDSGSDGTMAPTRAAPTRPRPAPSRGPEGHNKAAERRGEDIPVHRVPSDNSSRQAVRDRSVMPHGPRKPPGNTLVDELSDDSQPCDIRELDRPKYTSYQVKPFSPMDLGSPLRVPPVKRRRVKTPSPEGSRQDSHASRNVSVLPARAHKRKYEETEDALPAFQPPRAATRISPASLAHIQQWRTDPIRPQSLSGSSRSSATTKPVPS
ncbi:hypothetical protein HWV62_41196 [Athelia sp. TMB]|nr:hypothetical protein HWV62_41196 [Athelia sp. TMB]